MHDLDDGVRHLAAAQHGRFTRAQVKSLHPSPDGIISRRITAGHWLRLTSRVLALPGAAGGFLADCWTAHLHTGPDSVIGGPSAAELHGLQGAAGLVANDADPAVTLVVHHPSHRRCPSAVVHQTGDLDDVDVVRRRGLPVTSVARTLVDLSPLAGRARLEAMVDDAVARRLVGVAELAGTVHRMNTPGRGGLERIIEVVGRLVPGGSVPESVLERQLWRVAELSGIVPGHPQHRLPTGQGEREGRVDLAWPEVRLFAEADGRMWHQRQQQARIDRARDRASLAAGWATMRWTWEELMADPEGCAAELRAVYQRLLAG